MDIDNLYRSIAERWTPERYISEKQNFQNIQKHIINTETPTSVKCPRCKTIWDTDLYICHKYKVCTICDYDVHPNLANPKNKVMVLKFIPKKYHRYLLPDKDVYGFDIIHCNNGMAICEISPHEHSSEDADNISRRGDEDVVVHMGPLSKIEEQYKNPIDYTIINEIPQYIKLEDKLVDNNLTLTIDVISRQIIILKLQNLKKKYIPFSIEPNKLHSLTIKCVV